MDTQGTSPVELYDLGMSHLALGNLEAAEDAFRRSLVLAARSGLDFAPPHEGMARILLKRNRLEQAEAEAMHAQELDNSWAPVYWVLGKINERQGHTDLALVHYQRGLIASPDNQELIATAADLLRRVGRNSEADEIESGKIPAGKPPGQRPPDRGAPPPASPLEAKTRRLLEPFFPKTPSALTPEVLAVFYQENLTRGALAILVTGDGEHGLAEALNRTTGIEEGTTRPPSDTQGRPEADWIHRALAMGLLEPYPDGSFKPDQTISRLTLALWIEETIARLRNDTSVFQLYRGQKSSFQDLPDGHYGLNAARIAVDLGLLEPRTPVQFAPDDLVRMEEGIEAVRRLGPALLGQRR